MEIEMERISTDNLVQDLRLVVENTESLLKATARQAGAKANAARAQAEKSVRAAKRRLAQTGEDAVERTRAAALAGDEYIHENAWAAIGTGAGIGFLLGYLIGRR